MLSTLSLFWRVRRNIWQNKLPLTVLSLVFQKFKLQEQHKRKIMWKNFQKAVLPSKSRSWNVVSRSSKASSISTRYMRVKRPQNHIVWASKQRTYNVLVWQKKNREFHLEKLTGKRLFYDKPEIGNLWPEIGKDLPGVSFFGLSLPMMHDDKAWSFPWCIVPGLRRFVVFWQTETPGDEAGIASTWK